MYCLSSGPFMSVAEKFYRSFMQSSTSTSSYSVHAELASSPPPSSFVGIVSSGFNTEDSVTFSSCWVIWAFP